MKQAILLLTQSTHPGLVAHVATLRAQLQGDDVVVLYHQRAAAVCPVAHVPFTDAVLTDLGYTPLRPSLLPGSNHFPLLAWYRAHPQYAYYWLIEDDVRFTGDWGHLVHAFDGCPAALLSSHVRDLVDDAGWDWVDAITHPTATVSLAEKVGAFNPIYRLSHDALAVLDAQLLRGWSGHHEVVMPTLLKREGLALMDFGGRGPYVARANRDRFYYGENTPTPTHRFRPVFAATGSLRDKIYHPVKDLQAASCRGVV